MLFVFNENMNTWSPNSIIRKKLTYRGETGGTVGRGQGSWLVDRIGGGREM